MAQVLRPLNALFDAQQHDELIVGLGTAHADDAAVYRLPDGRVTVVTTDFFPPVVDDAADYGAIAAANAMSDVWAMGAEPTIALNIALFPSDMPIPIAQAILEGAALQVRDAGAVIVGGHTMDNKDLVYGLAVVGFGREDALMRKGGLRDGQALILTKGLGTGVLTTAHKRGALEATDLAHAVRSMRATNALAARAAVAAGATGATDITGFGLLGHALEMARASGAVLRLEMNQLPWLPAARDCARRGFFPGGARRNAAYFGPDVVFHGDVEADLRTLCFDPQTSGGLLFGVSTDDAPAVVEALVSQGLQAAQIGRVERSDRPPKIVVT